MTGGGSGDVLAIGMVRRGARPRGARFCGGMTRSPSPWQFARLTRPRFAGISDLVDRLADARDWPSVAMLNERFRAELASAGVQLVEAAKTRTLRGPDGMIDPASLYEVRIATRGEIPTRPRNTHDLCNALAWAAFPRAKLALSRALAEVQRARATGRPTLPAARTYAHDRLALIDEGGVICVAGSRTPRTWIFGHALYEHAYDGDRLVRGTAIDLAWPDKGPDHDGLGLAAARAVVDRALAAADLVLAARPGPGIPVE